MVASLIYRQQLMDRIVLHAKTAIIYLMTKRAAKSKLQPPTVSIQQTKISVLSVINNSI